MNNEAASAGSRQRRGFEFGERGTIVKRPPTTALLAFLLLASGSIGAPAFAEDGTVYGAATHRDWQSLVLRLQGRTVFRAATIFVEAGDVVSLTIDRAPEQCESLALTMNVKMNEPIRESFQSPALYGSIRVDEEEIHTFSYAASATRGDTTLFLIALQYEDVRGLAEEMGSGRVIRFRLPTERKTYYVRFSLDGYGEAVERTSQMCAYFGQQDDEQYFQDAPQRRRDSDFFRDEGQKRTF